MKNQKSWLLLIFSLIILVGLTGCGTLTQGPHGTVEYNLSFQGEPDPNSYFGQPESFTLWAGKTINVGEVLVSNNEEVLFVTFKTEGDWFLEEVHLYVLDYQPNERLAPGLAPYKEEGIVPTQLFTMVVPLDELGFDVELCETILWLQAHASVVNPGNNQQETAYGGEIVDNNQGAWYGNIEYLLRCDDNGEEEENGELQTETAWGGNSGINVGEPGAWWYYFDAEKGAEQTIWAGQTIEIGTVSFDDGKIKILLSGGWELQDVDEPVKIQGYEELPSSRPAAGLFTTYKGSGLEIEVPDFPYYAIHLDVQKHH